MGHRALRDLEGAGVEKGGIDVVQSSWQVPPTSASRRANGYRPAMNSWT